MSGIIEGPVSKYPLIYGKACEPFPGITTAFFFCDKPVVVQDSIYGLNDFSYQLNASGEKNWYQIILEVRNLTDLNIQITEFNRGGTISPPKNFDIFPSPAFSFSQPNHTVYLSFKDDGSKLWVLCSIKDERTGKIIYESGWQSPFTSFDRLITFSPVVVGYGGGSLATFTNPSFEVSLINPMMSDLQYDFIDPGQPVLLPCASIAKGETPTAERTNLTYKLTNDVDYSVDFSATA